jgi:hypothetical protein
MQVSHSHGGDQTARCCSTAAAACRTSTLQQLQQETGDEEHSYLQRSFTRWCSVSAGHEWCGHSLLARAAVADPQQLHANYCNCTLHILPHGCCTLLLQRVSQVQHCRNCATEQTGLAAVWQQVAVYCRLLSHSCISNLFRHNTATMLNLSIAPSPMPVHAAVAGHAAR